MTKNEERPVAEIPSNLLIPIGEVVKAWREFRQLKLTELARRSQLTRGYISQLEHNRIRQPDNDHLAKLAGALQIGVWDLVARRMPSEQEYEMPGQAAALVSPPVSVESIASESPTIGQEIDAILREEGLSEEEVEAVGRLLGAHVRQLARVIRSIKNRVSR